jgi:hypothetical protein
MSRGTARGRLRELKRPAGSRRCGFWRVPFSVRRAAVGELARRAGEPGGVAILRPVWDRAMADRDLAMLAEIAGLAGQERIAALAGELAMNFSLALLPSGGAGVREKAVDALSGIGPAAAVPLATAVVFSRWQRLSVGGAGVAEDRSCACCAGPRRLVCCRRAAGARAVSTPDGIGSRSIVARLVGSIRRVCRLFGERDGLGEASPEAAGSTDFGERMPEAVDCQSSAARKVLGGLLGWDAGSFLR